jgi:hypothetical protein
MSDERRMSGELTPRKQVWDAARRERYRRMLELAQRPLHSSGWAGPRMPARVR